LPTGMQVIIIFGGLFLFMHTFLTTLMLVSTIIGLYSLGYFRSKKKIKTGRNIFLTALGLDFLY